MRFLVDTAATTMLNLKSFSGGRLKEIQVSSWSGMAATSAREVSIPDLAVGGHHLRDLKLPAIDLSPIGNACGGPIDDQDPENPTFLLGESESGYIFLLDTSWRGRQQRFVERVL